MKDCPFCQIANGKRPSYEIAQTSDRKFYAFLDSNPVVEGHTLVIPKRHYKNIWEMPTREFTDFMKFAKDVVQWYQDVTNNKTIFSFIYGLHIEHAHIHVVPHTNSRFERKLREFNDLFKVEIGSGEAVEVQQKFQMTKGGKSTRTRGFFF